MDLYLRLYRLKIIGFIKKWKLVGFILGCIDILSIILAFQFAYLISPSFNPSRELFFFAKANLVYIFLLILPVWLVVLYLMQVTEIPRTKRYRVLFTEYMLSALVVALFLLLFYFFFSNFDISRRLLVEFVFLGFIFLFLVRFAEYKLFQTYRSKGFDFVNIVVIADDSSVGFIDKIMSVPAWGYRIKAIFSDADSINVYYKNVIDVIPLKSTDFLREMLIHETIDEVLYIKQNLNSSEIRKTIRLCEEFGVVFRVMTKEKQHGLTNAFITILAHEKFLTFSNIPHKSITLGIKKLIDVNTSVWLLILLSPVMLIIGLLIRITSSGPVIYKQERIGLRGRPFNLYKFRTMIKDADDFKNNLLDKNEMDGPAFKIKDDPRITKLGKFLRRTGLDELPQLVNVIKGEMSLIGPRPHLKEEIAGYKHWQLRRLSVKPGLTGLWQVKPERNSIKFEKWMELDLAYIDNWSLRIDFYIIIKTIQTIFHRTGY